MASSKEVLLCEALAQCLVRHDVRHLFGIPGGYLSALLDAFARAGIPSITSRHEGAAGFMAAGYAQASGKLGVLYASGPGATNTFTPIVGAYMDQIPLLLISGQPPHSTFGRDGHQEATGAIHGFDHVEIFAGLMGVRSRPPTAEAAVRMMQVALAGAERDRVPAMIDLTSNLLTQKVSFEDRPRPPVHSAPIDSQGIAELAELLQQAERPVLLFGDRLCHRNATADLVALCEEHEIPCAAVNYAKGIVPEDHPLYLGVLGEMGHGSAESYFSQADLTVTVGVRMNDLTSMTYQAGLFPNLVQIDNRAAEIGRVYPLRLGIVGDAPAAIRALRAALRGSTTSRSLRKQVAALRAEHSVYLPRPPAGGSGLTIAGAFEALGRVLPRETLVVSDTGLNAALLKRTLPIHAPDGFFALYALAPMGSGLPMALGVQLARPEAPVVSVIGDGGFLTHLGELSTAVQHNLPVVQVVIVNGLYGSVGNRLRHWFGHAYACDIKNPDYVQLAAAFGCDGYRATTGEQLEAAVLRALEARRPAVVEVPVAGQELMSVTPSSTQAFFQELFGDGTGDRPWPFPKP